MNIKKIIKDMTLEEKCRLLVGKDNWRTMDFENHGIKSLVMADGPHGLRKVVGENMLDETTLKAVCYPSLVSLASSFDPDLAYKMGKCIASEFKSQDVNVILGPGINIKRHPYCGRNFEYFSEDPLVTIQMAKGFIKGAKSEKVGVCLKHYAFNSQETYRLISDSIVDKRAKYEIYLKTFKELVDFGVDMVMCSYNKVDSVYASENVKLLKETLREEFGFDGVIVSDWSAVNDRTKALIATLDLEMPGYIYSVNKLINDFHKGLIDSKQIDDSVERILTLIDKFKETKKAKINLEKNHLLAKEIAADSFVLLKNEDNLLPINDKDSVLLIGEMAEYVRYQGGGSSHITTFKLESITKNLKIDYIKGYHIKPTDFDSKLIGEAVEMSKNRDKVIIVCGLPPEFESEGYDREHLSIPENQIKLINAVSEVNKNVILLMQMGSPVKMPFVNKVKAILNIYLAGEALGLAAKDVLYGKVNPSGRLAETFPLTENDIPSKDNFANGNNEVHYKESIFVGYRYYNTFDIPVLFPFGHGLSYTSFSYSNLKISQNAVFSNKTKISLSVDVTNTGNVFGKEVVMLFFEPKNSKIPRPKRELLDFKKVAIEASETINVTFEFTCDQLNYYDVGKSDYLVEDGKYALQICKNVNEVIIEENLDIERNVVPLAKEWSNLESYSIDENNKFKDEDFEKLIGRQLGPVHIKHKRPFDLNNNIEDIEHTLIGKVLKKQINKQLTKSLLNQTEDFRLMITKSISRQPLRSIVTGSGGKISMNFMTFLLEMINFRFIKAIKHLFKKD